MFKLNPLVAVALLALMISLAGCGGSGPVAPITPPTPPTPFVPPTHGAGNYVAVAFVGTSGESSFLPQDSADHWTTTGANLFRFAALPKDQVSTMVITTAGDIDNDAVVAPKAGPAIKPLNIGWLLSPYDYSVDIPYPSGVIHAHLSIIAPEFSGLTVRSVPMDTDSHPYAKDVDGFYVIPAGKPYWLTSVWSDDKDNPVAAPDGYNVWGYAIGNGSNIHWDEGLQSGNAPGDVHNLISVSSSEMGPSRYADTLLLRFVGGQ